jgi:hypothetical protein
MITCEQVKVGEPAVVSEFSQRAIISTRHLRHPYQITDNFVALEVKSRADPRLAASLHLPGTILAVIHHKKGERDENCPAFGVRFVSNRDTFMGSDGSSTLSRQRFPSLAIAVLKKR